MDLHAYQIAGLACIALLAFVLPFVPGWIELKKGKDGRPLHIDMGYTKSPFFFGDNFHALLLRGLRPGASGNAGAAPALEDKEYAVTLSKPEKVRVFTAPLYEYPASARVNKVVYAAGDLEVGAKSRFGKEVCAEGNAVLGGYVRMRAILCRGDLALGEGTRIERWVDARGKAMTAAAGCDLGRSAASAGTMQLGPDVAFRNLYGVPVSTFAAVPQETPPEEGNIRDEALVATNQLVSIPAKARIDSNIIAAQDLKIHSGAVVNGDIKGHRNVELEDNVTVTGTIVAEGDITVGPRCRIAGNLFAQGDVRLGFGCLVGEEAHIRSVVSRSAVHLDPGVVIYGCVTCEQGKVARQEPVPAKAGESL